MWLSVWSKVHIVCIWSSWCYCFPKRHNLLPHLNPDWFYLSGTGLHSSCTGYLCGNAFTTSWRVSPFVHCLVWRLITLPATVSWLATLDWDLCDLLSDVSALCHVITARSAIDPSRRLGRVHGMSCRSIYVTLHYGWLSSMHTWRTHLFSISCGATAHLWHLWFLCAAYKCTYLLTYTGCPAKEPLNGCSVVVVENGCFVL